MVARVSERSWVAGPIPQPEADRPIDSGAVPRNRSPFP